MLRLWQVEVERIKNFRFCMIILIFTLCILNLLSGCAIRGDLKQAQGYVRQSRDYYQAAVQEYKKLIAEGGDVDKLHYQLGQLYSAHGELNQAVEEFKHTGYPPAKKSLAITYYRLGNFTDAYEVFTKHESMDHEYLYYYGLTCEELNLFDQALDTYKKIKEGEFTLLALQRINAIEKTTQLAQIKDIDPQVDKILAQSPTQKEYPQAGALILSCNENVEITADNKEITSLHYLIKILNERGKESFSEAHIDYDSTYEKVQLESARTIKPDGRVVDVGSRHIRDVSKYLNFPLYSNVRAHIISFPEITEGATIEYKVKIYRNQLINKKDFILYYPVQGPEPIITANFTLDVPQEKSLKIKTLNADYNNFGANLEPLIKEASTRRIYQWQFRDIPQIIPESNMPPHVEINPTLLISTFTSWDDVYHWWWSLAKDKIELDETMKDKVAELTQGLISEEAKVRAIYNFCAQKIRYVAVEYGEAGYEPHRAIDIFKNKYGDCKDQAILLVAMLEEVGLRSWPVLISTKEYHNLNPDFPAVFFNHCLVAVPIKERVVFLDPTALTCAFGDLPSADQGRKVLIFKKDGFEIQDTPLYPAEHNFLKHYLQIKINPDESISACKTVSTHGLYEQAQRLWLLYTLPELIEETLKEKIQEVSIGATLEDYEIKNVKDLNMPVELGYTFKGPEYFTLAGFLRIMPQLTGLDTSLVAKDKRKYPIDFEILNSKETIFEIAIPGGFIVKYMPADVSEDSPWLKFSVEYTYKDNKIWFKQSTQLKKIKIAQDEYPSFKNFFEDLAKKVKQRIVLEKNL